MGHALLTLPYLKHDDRDPGRGCSGQASEQRGLEEMLSMGFRRRNPVARATLLPTNIPRAPSALKERLPVSVCLIFQFQRQSTVNRQMTLEEPLCCSFLLLLCHTPVSISSGNPRRGGSLPAG